MIVTLFYFPGDQRLAAKLSNWIATLGPNKGHTALLARDVRCHANVDSEILANFQKVFDKVEVITIVERVDGWPQGANVAFGRVAKHIQYTNPQPWLWIEPDCVPMKEGWVQALATEYDQEPRKPFLGDFVQVENVPAHMSGVAVYYGKITDYAGDATLAMETAWDVYAASQIVPQMKQTQLIQHKWKHPPFNNQSEVDNLLGQLKDTCVLFHADKSGTLIDFLRERRDGRKPQQSPVAVNVGAGIGTVDVFIKTYEKDYPWLKWCLRSIQKFASGFRNTVCITSGELWELGSNKLSFKLSDNFKVYPKEEYGNDHYLSQQVFKLYADTFTDSDWILFTDSDTIFTRLVTPETYLKDGKFVWMMTPMAEAHPDEQQAWRRVMRKFFGKEPEFEFMRRHPFLLPRWLLADLRAFCVRQHGVELKDYVMAQPYREFTEFNILGMYAYEYHRDKFEWLDTSKVPESDWPILTVDQQWSHNPIPVEKWEKILSSVPVLAEPANLETDCRTGEARESTKRNTQDSGQPEAVSHQPESRGTTQTNLSVGHGEEKQPVPILRGSPLGESPKPDRQLTLKEKRQQQAAKMREAKELKRRFNLGVAETLKEWPVLSESEIAELEKDHAKHLEYHLKEVAKYFNSPLAKGRIFKRLKAFPVLK